MKGDDAGRDTTWLAIVLVVMALWLLMWLPGCTLVHATTEAAAKARTAPIEIPSATLKAMTTMRSPESSPCRARAYAA